MVRHICAERSGAAMAVDLIATIRVFEALRGTLAPRTNRPAQSRPHEAKEECHDRSGGSFLVEAADAVRNGDDIDGVARCSLAQHGSREPEAERDDLAGSQGAEQAARGGPGGARESWLGPLHGVPMMHKDMYQAGWLSNCGWRCAATGAPQSLPP
jgi:hypothetical protein